MILAGARVASAFGISFSGPFCWKLLPRGARDAHTGLRDLVWFAMIPHPSGCNRFYNEPRNRRACARFLRAEVFGRASRVLAEGMCCPTA